MTTEPKTDEIMYARWDTYEIAKDQMEFIREELDRKGRKYVCLTDKGFKFLEKYRVLKGFIEEFEL